MNSGIHDLASLRDALRDFVAARGWRVYHTPKNLAMALIVEAAELVEHFQWATAEESLAPSPEKLAEVPEIEVTRIEDIIEWDCGSLLRPAVTDEATKAVEAA